MASRVDFLDVACIWDVVGIGSPRRTVHLEGARRREASKDHDYGWRWLRGAYDVGIEGWQHQGGMLCLGVFGEPAKCQVHLIC
jgi:hypothetical protein